MRLIAAALAMFLVLAAGEVRAGFDEGIAAYKRWDYATALREFRVPAEQGDAEARYNLGVMYDNGQGVPQDYAETMKWYRKAANQGNVMAQYNLGIIYDAGLGVSQDYVSAHVWLELSVARGKEQARKNRDKVADKMTPAQTSEARRLAKEWMEKHQK